MKRNRPNLFWGLILILLGGFFLAVNSGVVPELSENLWGAVFAVVSLLFFVGYVSSRARNWGLLFPATISLAVALTLWLNSANVAGNTIGGIFMFAVSIPFWVGYLVNRQRHWGLLIPAWILAIIGVIVLFANETAGELIGALVLFAIGAPFFVVFLANRKNWWALIPGWVMSVLGVIVLLANSVNGELIGALFMFAVALPFLVVFAVRAEHWWALIPAGVMATIGVTVLLTTADLSEAAEIRIVGGTLFAGLGLTFAALWLLRRRHETDWAKYPAVGLSGAALLVVLSGALFEYVWPVALIGAGLWLLVSRSSQPAEKSLSEEN